jgi:hypothetical protein
METDIYLYMIRLQDLITEITLGGVQPYATQFTWRFADPHYEAAFEADGNKILFAFTEQSRAEWSFGILTQTADREGWTVTHARSSAVGQINYLRLMSTVAEAILDFAALKSPESIDITGSDPGSTEKDLQKTRIYRMMLQANSARLAAAGYTWLYRNGKLWIVRKARADASGIDAASN